MEGEGQRNIAAALDGIAARQGDAVALISREGGRLLRTGFATLQQRSCSLAAGLARRGVRSGLRVMLMVPPSLDFYALTFALFRLGAVVIFIDPGMGYANLLRCITSVRPEILIAIPRAQLFSLLFRTPFASVRKRICAGPSLGLLGTPLARLDSSHGNTGVCSVSGEDAAAILFTTGSTGPPKGVCYSHDIFFAQLELIRDYYGIGPGEIDQPGFPLFGLFSTALGATVVVPEMDPAHPARVDPVRFVASLQAHRVSYSFGSPAIWKVVSAYCLNHKIVLPVKKILMAGAPVPAQLIARVARIMPPDGTIHTPYGATECLPLTSISGSEVLDRTQEKTMLGGGVCVGRPLPGMRVRIIKPQDGVIDAWDHVEELAEGQIGEIVAQGPVVTRSYDNAPKETRAAKIPDIKGNRLWHRMGDMGYLDGEGRLWFCGRKAHRVLTEQGPLYTIPCEALFNTHPGVNRSALVGVGEEGRQLPVLIGESKARGAAAQTLLQELAELAISRKMTKGIRHFLLHPGFPVDVRHNAKIFREELAVWAAGQLEGR